MSATAREYLRRKLSPRSYQQLRLCWWHGHFYLPHLVSSVFVRRVPKVQFFPNTRASTNPLDYLRAINLLVPTELCRVMTKHGSDKGSGFHNYTTIYAALFGKLRNQPIRVFELGLGTNNPELTSSMGITGRPGASLRGWREFFRDALIYGADIDRDILFEENHIQTFYCDQVDTVAIRDLWSQPALRGGMDIIIDDGLHTFEGNVSFLEGSLDHLRPSGIYVVEDILNDTIEKWRDQLETNYSRRFPNHDFALIELPNSRNGHDNNLLIIHKSSQPVPDMKC
jgi:hypothetical protein